MTAPVLLKRPFWIPSSFSKSMKYFGYCRRTFNGMQAECEYVLLHTCQDPMLQIVLAYATKIWYRSEVESLSRYTKKTLRGRAEPGVARYMGNVRKRRGHVLAVNINAIDWAGVIVGNTEIHDILVLDDGKGTFTIEGRALGEHRP